MHLFLKMWWLLLAITSECDTDLYTSQARHRRGLFEALPSGDAKFAKSPILYYIPNGTGDSFTDYQDFSVKRCLGEDAQQTAEENIQFAIDHYEEHVPALKFQRVYSIDLAGPPVIVFVVVPYHETDIEPAFNRPGQACNSRCFVNGIGLYHTPGEKHWHRNIIHLGGCWDIRGSIIHEIGHKLGMEHEQKRTDRDVYLTVSNDIADFSDNNIFDQWHSTVDFLQPNHTFDFCSNQMYHTVDERWSGVTVTDAGYQAMIDCMLANTEIYEQIEGINLETCTQGISWMKLERLCGNKHRQRVGLSIKDIEALNEIYPLVTETSESPTVVPPTASPTASPTLVPSQFPSESPTVSPTLPSPTTSPTLFPTESPTVSPTLSSPTTSPTLFPTESPTVVPPTTSPSESTSEPEINTAVIAGAAGGGALLLVGGVAWYASLTNAVAVAELF